ncbi:MAG TPA: BlaI/MecI/CopY family transcriptional regulator [Candidatus Hydrogenedentes bacterium]|mgnify:CR=1 FL=1|nr:BlaI/MecI/CopY family transcriptional regulator [Candidatus Hydrogenedentota bacterium]HPG65309.1 BlaI/MecI/CopY family transcriptional regulator [Candidatus Hydrogenedentota bacterium]
MVRKTGDVSDAEMEVLQTLWKEGPATVREVSERLGSGKNSWAYTTVQTLLGRLEAKGSVKSDKTGLAHVFSAAITRERFLSDRLLELADKVCDGTTMPLVMALVDKQRFTADEVAEFRRLLDEAAGAREGKKTRPNP